jgi:hypothetical protein
MAVQQESKKQAQKEATDIAREQSIKNILKTIKLAEEFQKALEDDIDDSAVDKSLKTFELDSRFPVKKKSGGQIKCGVQMKGTSPLIKKKK